ncbi:Eco57I restriction-modification methylase domain-containing protein [Catenibacterium mitsuokai]|uniref:Eco57I restriction-modification methylase domain-containing protein n=1 Tax=Catenibacterium mitsuokai TaxID=100886 RepID=UPI003D094B47
MKFDFCIGNPPYQESQEATSDKPVYNHFIDAAYDIADKVELITPARFLFNAGKTPKTWNQKMLDDEHVKVAYYEQDSSKVFSNTDIKGGVAITYRDADKCCGAIETFTQFSELNHILKKVKSKIVNSISDFVFSPESYKFTNDLYVEHPEILEMKSIVKGKEVPLISKGHEKDLTSNIFDKLFGVVFFQEKPLDGAEYVQIAGRMNNSRVCLWIKKNYIANHDNLHMYKVFFPKASGSGKFGESLSDAIVAKPEVGHTQTFISIGAFKTQEEAEFANKYLRSKFARALLGVLKVTQDNKKSVWKYVPLQDFTSSSDIDWSQSIANIDKQLYKKYNLSDEEINFIETNVKEME